MSVRARLIALAVATFSGAVGVALVAIVMLGHQADETRRVATNDVAQMLTVGQVQKLTDDAARFGTAAMYASSGSGPLAERGPQARAEVERLMPMVNDKLVELGTYNLSMESRALLDQVIDQTSSLNRAGQPLLQLDLPVLNPAAPEIAPDQIEPVIAERDRAIAALTEQIANEVRQAAESSAARSSHTRTILAALLVIAGSVIAAVSFLTIRRLLGGLSEMRAVLDDVARGDLRARVAAGSRDEIGRMGGALNDSLGATGAVIKTIDHCADELAAEADRLAERARSITAHYEEVAEGAGRMSAAITQISSHAQEAAAVAGGAVDVANRTGETVGMLGSSSDRIGAVVGIIAEIAEQTSLLALNATIEAARAGEAGKGFAVVAAEVKELSQATNQATGEIREQIERIQTDSLRAVSSIREISDVVYRINEIQSQIAGAVEEQAVSAQQIGASAEEAARATGDIAGAGGRTNGADRLGSLSRQLQALVDRFEV